MSGLTVDESDRLFSPDGKLLATGGADRSIRLWNPRDWQERYRWQGYNNQNVYLRSTAGLLITTLIGHPNLVKTLGAIAL